VLASGQGDNYNCPGEVIIHSGIRDHLYGEIGIQINGAETECPLVVMKTTGNIRISKKSGLMAVSIIPLIIPIQAVIVIPLPRCQHAKQLFYIAVHYTLSIPLRLKAPTSGKKGGNKSKDV